MHASNPRRSVLPPSLIVLGLGVGLLAGALGGCSPDALVGEGELPPGVSDPAVTESPQGAVAAYNGALIAFRTGFAGGDASLVPLSALLGDELQTLGPAFFPWADTPTDRRLLPEVTVANQDAQWYTQAYQNLHSARGKAREGVRLLRQFAPNQSPALAGHLHALEAYADVFLADLFCSGVPLSTVDEGGFTLRPGSSTTEIYERAVELLDTALAVSADSDRVLNVARVGKGRALLALGQYADAAQAVAAVPDGFEYRVEFDATSTDNGATKPDASFMWMFTGAGQSFTFYPTMSDGEGGNGLDYLSSGDPRTEAVSYASHPFGIPQFLPAKYAPDGGGSVMLADWREARLIEAEAALQGGDVSGWLAKLNYLRQAGIAPALPDLVDPGSPDARVDLLFRERAFWLFLAGHREGDMRRLIRQYARDPSSVFPIGVHPRGGTYGTDVNAPVPPSERLHNHLFTGCLGRGA
ncbi:MAG: hypothetical protein ACREOQ_14710 [Gemmatimonadales bacterium]